MNFDLSPKEIVEKLDKYIISQEDAKKNVAISLRNRYRRKSVENESVREEIMPKNIILIGPTGVGKTEIARRLAKITNAPFIKVEATKYTEVGYVGKDVESMIKDLVAMAYRAVQDEFINSLKEEYLETVYDKLAKELAPYSSLNLDDKDKLIEEIKNGDYDDKEIEVESKAGSSISPVIEIYSDPESGGGDINQVQGAIDDIMSNIGAFGKSKKKNIKVKNAVDYLLKDEIEKNLDKEVIIEETLNRVENDGIIFIDEIDKIAEREGGRSDVSRQGVQRDILPIVEGTTVMTKYGPVKTDHILFIAAGAFSMAKPSDLMPELQGRFPITVKLRSLKKEDFVKILTDVDNSLIKQYMELLKIDDVALTFSDDAIDKVAEYAITMNKEIENIGARRLATIIEEVLKDIMFEAPYDEKREIKIEAGYIDEKLKYKKKRENLDDYIL